MCCVSCAARASISLTGNIFNYAPIAQAKAWLSGRDTVEPSDLTTLCAYLWTAPEERTIIQSTLERMCNDPLKDRLDTILAEAVEGYQEFTDTGRRPCGPPDRKTAG